MANPNAMPKTLLRVARGNLLAVDPPVRNFRRTAPAGIHKLTRYPHFEFLVIEDDSVFTVPTA